MTQSGQGEEPSARPAHEGIVLPSDGGEPLLPGQQPAASGSAVPAGGQAWGQPWGPGQSAQSAPAQNWHGDAGQQWGAPQQPGAAPGAEWGAPGAQPSWESGAHQQGAASLPPAVGEAATQYIPPVPAGADEGATQYIPPVGPGALPPESPADGATPFHGAPGGPRPGADPDAQATQYLPPVPGGQPGPAPYGAGQDAAGGDRQTPAEFDNLFRHDAGAAESTQNLPQFDDAPGGRAAARRSGGDGGGGRGSSRVPLLAAAGIGIVVLGIGAGALLSGGDGSDRKDDDSTSVAATAPAESAPEQQKDEGADPAKGQAEALDKLLADSGNSRGAVIKAVDEIKGCQNLGQAANDLRDAAKQRNELVTRLSQIGVDKLPDHEELTTALTNAWRASESADNHYAAWADQVAGQKKACKKGQARPTGETAEGNKASGTATAEKEKAARLWNTIAQQYGLTQRQPTQL
ncbi:hypothetical protein BJY54_002951 [Streptomyces nodosus]|uniref:Uncharacterized protein n=1 Tax=Streptomyces nodosus TaxID=40318 RepID=A0A5P2W7B4_9ACTN|nr:hypothetical protein [Streptomyces nodosus]MBB4792339.1 hypothetical protein [Streptomyces nodosus]QEV39733.1 hypothetical protein CP978_15280 [Streptomyces nodosus]